jgi:hypothetical protein
MATSLVSRILVVVAAGCLLVSGCTQDQGGGLPTPSAADSPSPQPTPSPPALKQPLGGLLDRAGPSPAAFLSVMGGFVVNVHWQDLQPAPGSPIAANNAIDQAIATLHQIDPSGRMGLKVRLFAGIFAPAWAKSLGGSPVRVADAVTGASGSIGRFWTPAFGAAYADLETKLAAKYDSAPEIREVTISRCTTVYVEPFIRDTADPAAVQALLSAGFTVAADQTCHREEILAHQVWVHTRSDLSFNPYQVVGAGLGSDESFTEEMMSLCRATLGPRCVLANNSLRTPLQFPALYAQIKSLGPPIAFQTAVLNKVGNLGATIDAAIALGAGSVELPAGFESLPVSVLTSYNSRLSANALNS